MITHEARHFAFLILEERRVTSRKLQHVRSKLWFYSVMRTSDFIYFATFSPLVNMFSMICFRFHENAFTVHFHRLLCTAFLTAFLKTLFFVILLFIAVELFRGADGITDWEEGSSLTVFYMYWYPKIEFVICASNCGNYLICVISTF